MDADTSSDQRPPQTGEGSNEARDWRMDLMPNGREIIVNKILDTLKRHLPFSGQEGLLELHRIAARFEEKVYDTASSQSDYLRRIAIKMLTMEAKQAATRPPSNLEQHHVPDANINSDQRPPQTGEASNEAANWRVGLMADSRRRIVNKILDKLKRHLPFSGQEGLLELHRIATRFEEKIYAVASSQLDYLRKISLKLLTMESRACTVAPSNLKRRRVLADEPE